MIDFESLKLNDRVLWIEPNGKEVRGTVSILCDSFIVVEVDGIPIRVIIPYGSHLWLSLEKIDVYRAHSLKYLRGLPKEDRPELR